MASEPFESSVDAYPIRLENFEGPLDLLLHLIRQHQVNVYDIPIALITSQYLDYLDVMQELNLDVAGDFLVMAATLIHIKSRLLLPRPAPEQPEDEEDPRDALVRRLVEHQQFKAAAEMLHERETVRSAQWTRAEGRLAEIAGEAPEPELEVDLFSLMSAFKAVLTRAKQRPQMVAARRAPVDRGAHRAVAGAPVDHRGVRLRRAVRRRRHARRARRHLPGAPRDDPSQGRFASTRPARSATSASTGARPPRPARRITTP